jgi:hypothetical protein
LKESQTPVSKSIMPAANFSRVAHLPNTHTTQIRPIWLQAYAMLGQFF